MCVDKRYNTHCSGGEQTGGDSAGRQLGVACDPAYTSTCSHADSQPSAKCIYMYILHVHSMCWSIIIEIGGGHPPCNGLPCALVLLL